MKQPVKKQSSKTIEAVIETPSFGITTLQPDHIAEIQKLKSKVLSVVESNPVIEINDNKTYLKAKENRKNVREVRIEVEREEKGIPAILTSFRKRLGAYLIGDENTEGLSKIAQDREDAQDEIVKAWEKKKQDEADERERIANERADAIKNEIKEVIDELKAKIENTTFDNLESDTAGIRATIKQRLKTFHEFDVLFNIEAEKIEQSLKAKAECLTQNETNRKEKIRSRISETEKQVQELILGCPFDAIEITTETIENILTGNHDYQEFTSEFEAVSDKLHGQWKKRIQELNDQKELEEMRAGKRYDARAERLVEIGMDKLENGDFKVFDLIYKKSDIIKDNDEIFANTAKSIETFIETEVNKSNITKVDTVVDQLTKGIENSIDTALENYHEDDVDKSQLANELEVDLTENTNITDGNVIQDSPFKITQGQSVRNTTGKIDYVAMVEAKTAGETFPAPTDFATDADFQSEDNIPLGGGNVFHQATESIEWDDVPNAPKTIGTFITIGELQRLIDKLDSDAVFAQPMMLTKWGDGYSLAVEING